MTERKREPVVIRAWGGFCDGELYIYRSGDGAAIFKTRAIAREQYSDVRRIEIREVRPSHD